MAYAFENVAHGHQETKYAPALKYSQDSVVPPTVRHDPGTGIDDAAAEVGRHDGHRFDGEKAIAHLVGGVKFDHGKLVATVACSGTVGTCHVILEISDGKYAGMEVPVSVAAGKKKTVKVKPSKSLLKATKKHPKAKVSVRLVVAEGSSQKVKVG